MTPNELTKLFEISEATWPPAAFHEIEGWVVRDGAGGGQRVSSTTAAELGTLPDIEMAEKAMAALDQPNLFMIRKGEHALDAALDARGYTVKDPVVMYSCPVKDLTGVKPPRVSTFNIFPPLQIMRELWAEGGIGPARINVMLRAKGPKTTVLGRQNDRAAGVAYVGIHQNTAVLHALEVSPDQRRQGVAINIMRAAAHWAQDQGAETLLVLVTQENKGANALYSSLSMQNVGNYHYRIKAA
ncbi:GNAT family N-acetyltransferase [Pseudohalocynthiibacter aestuariivivens]|jgi:N-acetylglutamate synthase|uniref:GNAT family N-acetyltransferase n=1 Tax=Pseudohalocynthiibacter aestuariivivens TaxID=1591409 RepID=A0ABV5JK84_9RHOB|nr:MULTISPECIES: GNAT family N-acetyltransferase [Pseudohalocynthiibacter]MBS9715396.1 GNAT family N-acetyltransferase [Pseudohalocynthiibacter aestuariivivens]MCK0102658.1 GNAT family N-acetyltransferase [Pseudohalocynthiibacter sp. F2068]